jgi:hypothetical protein
MKTHETRLEIDEDGKLVLTITCTDECKIEHKHPSSLIITEGESANV